MNLKFLFLKHCEDKDYEVNQNQLNIINDLNNYYTKNFRQNLFAKIFKKTNINLGFYLVGDVGVGKTMILDFFFDKLNERKIRLHFNEFMIEFHNFVFKNKDKSNAIDLFVKDLKDFYNDNFDQTFLNKIFKKKNNKLGFYLVGDVGVGKTMILNFFFKEISERKLRLHFNEFMIEFHNFVFENKNKEKGIELFVENLKKNYPA